MNRAVGRRCQKNPLSLNLAPLKRRTPIGTNGKSVNNNQVDGKRGAPVLVRKAKLSDLLNKIILTSTALHPVTLSRFATKSTANTNDVTDIQGTKHDKESPGLLTKVKEAFPDKQELLDLHANKMQTAHQMSDYVSNMVKDYFSSEYLWKVLAQQNKEEPKVSSTKEVAEEKEAVPKFIQRREKVKQHVSQNIIDNHTRYCVANISVSKTEDALIFRLSEFKKHLQSYPHSREYACKLKAQQLLLGIRGYSASVEVKKLTSELLGRLGYQDPLWKSKGIRILSIDGGGMKGVIALEILRFETDIVKILVENLQSVIIFRKLEEQTGQPIYKLFDYMVGVSTGSIIVALLAFQRLSVEETLKIYKELGAEVFNQSYIKAVTGIVTSHSYYDTAKYEDILKSFAKDLTMATTLEEANCPKVAFVSAVLSGSKRSVKPFVFRNYTMPHRVTSNYKGSSKHQVWAAVRASSAAPGYFDGYHSDGKVFQDGALISNNPSHIGLHEAKQLWPNEPLQCMV